jgi:hypothetical protein
MGLDSVMKSMDRFRKVHDFLVSGQQPPSIHQREFWIGCAIMSDINPLWQKCERSFVDHFHRSGIPSGCWMPRRVFRWYRPLGSTTGYKLPSLRDEEVCVGVSSAKRCKAGPAFSHPEGLKGG